MFPLEHRVLALIEMNDSGFIAGRGLKSRAPMAL